MEMMDIVDANDQVIGRALKEEVYAKKRTHRIVHVWIKNAAGQTLIHRRSAACRYCPSHWSMSAAGHVDAGETYEQAAKRELREELGVDAALRFLSKYFYTDDPRGLNKFIVVFAATAEGPFDCAPDEVAEVAFKSSEEIAAMIARGEPFHPQFLYVFNMLFGQPTT